MTLDEAAEAFRAGDGFMLTTHASPDADGLGAQYALRLGLAALGKRVRAVNASACPSRFAFIDERQVIEALSPSEAARFSDGPLTLVLLDTNDIGYTGGMAAVVAVPGTRVMIVDHHEPLEAGNADACSVVDASSTCELAYGILKRLGVPVMADMARALFAGMVYDTGSFAYAKTGPGTLLAAYELMLAGAVPYEVHGALYESSGAGALLMAKEVLSTLELRHGNQVAVQTLSRRALADTGADYEDAEDLVNVPLRCRDVEVSVLFKENLGGQLRCSLRSKGRVNVAHVAQAFGGGGHRAASGFKSGLPLDTVRAQVLESLESALDP